MDYKQSAEYHRGYEDGRAARDADEWYRRRERKQVYKRLTLVELSTENDSFTNLSRICSAIFEPSHGWDLTSCALLLSTLGWLLNEGTEHNNYAPPTAEQAILDAISYALINSDEPIKDIAKRYAAKLEGDGE